MILHAFWDFSSFVGNPPGAGREVSDGGIGQMLAMFAAVVITLIVLRRLFREAPLAEG